LFFPRAVLEEVDVPGVALQYCLGTVNRTADSLLWTYGIQPLGASEPTHCIIRSPAGPGMWQQVRRYFAF
jgi:hypothetical protein